MRTKQRRKWMENDSLSVSVAACWFVIFGLVWQNSIHDLRKANMDFIIHANCCIVWSHFVTHSAFFVLNILFVLFLMSWISILWSLMFTCHLHLVHCPCSIMIHSRTHNFQKTTNYKKNFFFFGSLTGISDGAFRLTEDSSMICGEKSLHKFC